MSEELLYGKSVFVENKCRMNCCMEKVYLLRMSVGGSVVWKEFIYWEWVLEEVVYEWGLYIVYVW